MTISKAVLKIRFPVHPPLALVESGSQPIKAVHLESRPLVLGLALGSYAASMQGSPEGRTNRQHTISDATKRWSKRNASQLNSYDGRSGGQSTSLPVRLASC
jgi:hypothetical protein